MKLLDTIQNNLRLYQGMTQAKVSYDFLKTQKEEDLLRLSEQINQMDASKIILMLQESAVAYLIKDPKFLPDLIRLECEEKISINSINSMLAHAGGDVLSVNFKYEELYEVLTDERIFNQWKYEYLKYYSKCGFDSRQLLDLMDGISKLSSYTDFTLSELSNTERLLLIEPFFRSGLINEVISDRTVWKYFEEPEVKEILNICASSPIYDCRIHQEQIKEISRNTGSILKDIKSVLPYFPQKCQDGFIEQWLENDMLVYDLKQLKRNLPSATEDALVRMVKNRTFYLNFLYGDFLAELNLENVSSQKQDMLIYALTHRKKHFLSVVKEYFSLFLKLPRYSLLMDKEVYTTYLNLNTLNGKNLQEACGDIKGFFDNVSHGKLLKQLWTIGIQDKKLISIISAMLKGEIAEIGFPEKGTAQGSIISPLLSNVVLNELDWWIASQWEFMPTRHVYKEAIKANGTQSKSKKYRALRNSTLKECFIVRYADDFKIFCRKHKEAVVMFEATKQWLKTRLGLDISPEKSKIVNLKHSYSEFLGFRIKVHKKGKDTKCKPPVDKYVVKSHISEKALKKIKTNAKERIIVIQKTNGSRAGEYAIRDYNSFVMGIQNYYSMATCVNPDIQTLAYEIKTSIKIRLNTRVKRRTNEALTPYLSERYGKSKELRFINGVPLVPIGYVQHRVPLHKKAVVNKYTAEGRKEIHKQLETVDIERVHELMRNPISNETVEFNDNCVSLFVAQRGKCAICKLPLTLENMRCVRKIPKSCGGDDK